MKKLLSVLLSVTMLLTLAACGGQTKEAPDLNQYYEDFMAALGEDNAPANACPWRIRRLASA